MRRAACLAVGWFFLILPVVARADETKTLDRLLQNPDPFEQRLAIETLGSKPPSEAMIKTLTEKLSDEDLAANYPLEVFGHAMTTEFFLVHLATHLNYHLGQINYHRRLLGT